MTTNAYPSRWRIALILRARYSSLGRWAAVGTLES